MRSTYLIAGALVLALVAAGVLFGTDFFQRNPFSATTSAPLSSPEAQLMAKVQEAGARGGAIATFTEAYAKGWKLPAGYRLERFSINNGDTVFARLTSNAPRNNTLATWGERGLSFTFPVEFANQTNGKKLEIGIVARKALMHSSEAINVAYATQQAGHSGWQNLALTANFRLMKFIYAVPNVPEGYTNPPIIVLHSDTSGSGLSAEILGVYAKPIP